MRYPFLHTYLFNKTESKITFFKLKIIIKHILLFLQKPHDLDQLLSLEKLLYSTLTFDTTP